QGKNVVLVDEHLGGGQRAGWRRLVVLYHQLELHAGHLVGVVGQIDSSLCRGDSRLAELGRQRAGQRREQAEGDRRGAGGAIAAGTRIAATTRFVPARGAG